MKRTTTVACLTALLVLGLVVTSAATISAQRIPFKFSFAANDPCTGQPMTVTIQGVTFAREIQGRVVNTSARLISTDTGYIGHGTDTLVVNGQVNIFRNADVVTNDATGHQFVARVVFLLDLSTNTIRLNKVNVQCVR
jgi:hypothetical protein